MVSLTFANAGYHTSLVVATKERREDIIQANLSLEKNSGKEVNIIT